MKKPVFIIMILITLAVTYYHFQQKEGNKKMTLYVKEIKVQDVERHWKTGATWNVASGGVSSNSGQVFQFPPAFNNAIENNYRSGTNDYSCARNFLSFPLVGAGFTKYATVYAARIILTGYVNAGALKLVVAQSTYTPAASDETNWSAYGGYVEGEVEFDYVLGKNVLVINATGLAYINSLIPNEETIKFVLLTQEDWDGTAPTDEQKIGFYAGDTVYAPVPTEDQKIRIELEYALGRAENAIYWDDFYSDYDPELYEGVMQYEGPPPGVSWNTKATATDALNHAVSWDYTDLNTSENYIFRHLIKIPIEEGMFQPGCTVKTGTKLVLHTSRSGYNTGEDSFTVHLYDGTYDDRAFSDSTLDMYSEFGSSMISKTYASNSSIAEEDWQFDDDGIAYLQNSLIQDDTADFKFMFRHQWDINNISPPNDGFGWTMATAANRDSNSYRPYFTLLFNLPDNETQCEDAGWFWYDNQCNETLPTTESACEVAGGYWYGGRCNTTMPTAEAQCEGEGYFWYYGECQATDKLGVVECSCIDSANNIWLVAGHEVEEIVEVFASTSDSSEPRIRLAGVLRYEAYAYTGGLDGKIAVIIFSENAPSPLTETVTCNVKGMMNGSSVLIENPIEQLEHFLTEYLSLTSDEYNTVTFGTAETDANSRVYKTGGMIEGTESAKSVIENMAASWDMVPYFDRDGKLNVRFLN